MLFDFIRFLIMKSYFHLHRSGICGIPLLTLFNGIFNIISAQLEIDEFQAELIAVIPNRRNVLKYLFESFPQEPVVRVLLDFNKVGTSKTSSCLA